MKRVIFVFALLFFSSMMVFADLGHFLLMHHLGPKSSKYGIELKFYTANTDSGAQSPAISKDFLENTSEQYVGQIAGTIENQTDKAVVVYYNVFWTPFYKMVSGTPDTNYEIGYTMRSAVSENAGATDSSKMGKSEITADAIGNLSRKITILAGTPSKTIELFKLYLTLDSEDLEAADGGDYNANLVLEVLPET